ncbi:MAG: PilZ domain-containing protein [Lachnospiraceae bacterium]
MKLTEAEVGKSISVTLVTEGKTLNFNSFVTAVLDDSILIEPITEDEKTIGFNNRKVNVVYIAEETKPYIWLNVEIRLVKYNDQVYHQLITDGPGTKFNRRRSFRQYVGIEGMVNNVNETFSVIIKDVSANGCSFVTNQELEIGGRVIVSFSSDEENFVIRTMIIRKLEIEETGKIVYGCETAVPNHKIEKFVSDRQRKDMQRRSAPAVNRSQSNEK